MIPSLIFVLCVYSSLVGVARAFSASATMAVEAPLFVLFLGESSLGLLYASASVLPSMKLLQSAALVTTGFFQAPPGSFVGKTMAVILSVLLASSLVQVVQLQVRTTRGGGDELPHGRVSSGRSFSVVGSHLPASRAVRMPESVSEGGPLKRQRSA